MPYTLMGYGLPYRYTGVELKLFVEFYHPKSLYTPDTAIEICISGPQIKPSVERLSREGLELQPDNSLSPLFFIDTNRVL